MTHRIKWNEIEGTEDDTQNTADASNEKICVMMWQVCFLLVSLMTVGCDAIYTLW